MTKFLKNKILIALCLVLVLMLAACAAPASGGDAAPADDGAAADTGEAVADSGSAPKPLKIGISFYSYKEERFHREMDYALQRAEQVADEWDIEIIYSDSNHDANLQNTQVEDMITKGCDVIFIDPQDGEVAAKAVDEGQAAGVIMLSYCFYIQNPNIDGVLAQDSMEMGRVFAREALKVAPTGKYMFINGDPAATAAILMHKGAHEILDPVIEAGDIEVLVDQFIPGWDAERALSVVENTLTKFGNDVDAVICSNDTMAGGTTRALEAQGITGVYLTGVDGDSDAIKRVAEGKQNLSIMFDSKSFGDLIVDIAIAKMKDDGSYDDLVTGVAVLDDGTEIPAVNCKLNIITKDTIVDLYINNGYDTIENVYENVPKDQWPTVE